MTPTQYIGIEVVMKTDSPCDKFVRHFTNQGECVQVFPCDTHKSHIYFQPLAGEDPDQAIRNVCKLIAALPKPVRRQWDAASFREFCLGYEVGDQFSKASHFSREALSQAVAIGAGIGLALYSFKSSA